MQVVFSKMLCCRHVFSISILQLLLVTATVSSMSSNAATPSSQCAVVGCGVLGTSLCKQLLASPKDWSVTGITKSTTNHDSIKKAVTAANHDADRFNVVTMDECEGKTFDNVVFCAPPSGFDDYPGAVEHAASTLWSGLENGGTFVFTSSGGIHGPGSTEEAEIVNENSPTADPESSPRTARLIGAEEACRKNGGCCLRLAGLYTLERGAHSFWLNSGKDVSGPADGIINLLHYDDAASACLAALQVGSKVVQGRTFLISDGNPLTRKQICQSAMKAKIYADKKMPKFLGDDNEPKGKIYDGTLSNSVLQWKPKYSSFDEFMEMHS